MPSRSGPEAGDGLPSWVEAVADEELEPDSDISLLNVP
jgi:hypothetical protein